MKKNEKIEEAINKIGSLNNSEIIKVLKWTFNPFVEHYRYFDIFNREYKGYINRKGEIIVKVFPARIERHLNLKAKREYLIKGEKIFRKTDEEIASNFIFDFLKKRNFEVNENKKIKIINERKFEIEVNGHKGELEIGDEKNVLIDYQESEIAITTFSPISLIRKAIYGFGSSNLKNFYSEE